VRYSIARHIASRAEETSSYIDRLKRRRRHSLGVARNVGGEGYVSLVRSQHFGEIGM